MTITEQEFLQAPYASKVSCETVRYDDEPFFVVTVTLTDADQPAGTPSGDHRVRFVLDRDGAGKLLRLLGRQIEGVRLLFDDDPNPQIH